MQAAILNDARLSSPVPGDPFTVGWSGPKG